MVNTNEIKKVSVKILSFKVTLTSIAHFVNLNAKIFEFSFVKVNSTEVAAEEVSKQTNATLQFQIQFDLKFVKKNSFKVLIAATDFKVSTF